MDPGAGLLMSAAIGKVVRRLRCYLCNHSDTHKGTLKMLDLLEDKIQILSSEHPPHVKPGKELAAAEWLLQLNKATNEAEDLLHDIEIQVNADVSKASQALSGEQVIGWLHSDNHNLLRMKSTIGRLASVCVEGGCIFDMPNVEESLADLNKGSTSLPSDISKNEIKPLPDDALIIGRDEEIAMILDIVLGDARYVTSSLQGREEADKLQIYHKGWVAKILENIDLHDPRQGGSEIAPYRNEMWNKVHYTRITHATTDLRNPTVVPIVGISGVGKTALAQLIFNEERVQKHFQGHSGWVYLTDNTSEEKMMEHIITAFIDQDALTNTVDLQMELESIIEGRKFFLVLDDVWADICAIWGNLRRILRKGAPGSVVLVTTQLFEVASFMGTACPVVLDPLKSDDLWKLVKHYAFADPCSYKYAEALEPICRDIAAKLHGLPLAAKIIGATLRSNADEDHWNRILKSWWWKVSQNIPSANILSSLGISYCGLHGHLRQCFLLISIFPRNYIFEKCKLSQMWIANGFIQPNHISSSQRLEDIAGQWFDELVNLAFLGPSGCKTGFVMHDLVRDFALALSSNELRGVKTVNDSSQILQYLSIEMDDLNVQLSDFEIKHLKPIMFFADSGQFSSSDVPDKVEERTKSLCILDFSCSNWCGPTSYPLALGQDKGAPVRTLNVISRLKHLRYLDLSFTGINILPDSICSLCHLQVLGLRGCKFDKLPGNMNRLINLRHLHASSDTIAQINGIGKLAKLQELHEYRVKAEDGHRITELSKINDLRGSLRISDLEIVTDAEEARVANLDQKVYITALELRWSDALSIDTRPYLSNKTLGCLRPPRYLQDLKLDGYSGFDFPEWVGDMGQLRHVRAVELSSCKNACNLPPLGQLEHLKILKLHRLPGITAIDSKFCGSSDVVFRSLEELSFKDMESWVSWTYEGGRDFIPNLQKLQIRSCKHLRKVPFESLGSATKEILIDCGLYDDTGDMVSRYLQGLNGLSRLELCGYKYQWSGSKLFLPCKQLMSLEYLDIKEFEDVCIIGGLWHIRNLKDLRIIGCNIRIAELDEDKQAPIQIDRVMYSLTHLTLGGTKRHVLPVPENVFPHTPSLRNLRLYGLHSLTSITEKWLQHLTSLQELELSWCHGLPSGLASLSSLNRFILKHCGQIHSIPSSSLPGNLKEMRIEGCSHQLEQHCRNPSDEVWQQQGQRMLYWRNSKIRDWPRAKMHEREDRRHPWFHQERTDQANLWARKHQVDEQSFSEVENPSSVDAQLEEEEQEWLKEQERKFLATMGKDWPSICHVPYIRVNGRIVQNLYT